MFHAASHIYIGVKYATYKNYRCLVCPIVELDLFQKTGDRIIKNYIYASWVKYTKRHFFLNFFYHIIGVQIYQNNEQMKYIITLLLFLFPITNLAQAFLNGNFEQTTATENQINLSNYSFTTQMPYTTAFGSRGNVDIIKSKKYCGLAQKGDWFVALTSNGTDAISMKLSSPLIAGHEYILTFHDRACERHGPASYTQIGISDTISRFGTLIHQAKIPIDETWTRRIIKFIAPVNASFITVKGKGVDSLVISTLHWLQVDNFSLGCPNDLDLGVDTVLCAPRSINIGLNTTDATYSWNNGSTDSMQTIAATGSYNLEINHLFCNTLRDTIKYQN
jgi:hypothetical protein